MNRNFIYGMLGIFSLFSCTESEDIIHVDELSTLQTRSVLDSPISVIDSCLHIKDMDSYEALTNTLNNKTEDELIDWSKDKHYTSLLESYTNLKELSIIDENKIDTIEQNRLSSEVEATLFNQNGLLVVADTIYKVIDEYVYKVNIADVDLLDDIISNPDEYQSIRYKHTEKLVCVSETYSSVSDGERSLMIDVSSKRREYVKFFVSTSTKANGVKYVKLKMQGQAQKKGPLRRWKLPFDDELVWGQIHCDGILVNDNMSHPGAMSERKTNIQTITVPDIPLTAANLINQLKVHVNWRFCKNAVKGDEVYSYEYVNP